MTDVFNGVGCSVFLNNRYYDPTVGVFLSVDPMVASTGDPYLYAGGNPTTLADPSGLCSEGRDGCGVDANGSGQLAKRTAPTADPTRLQQATITNALYVNGIVDLPGSRFSGWVWYPDRGPIEETFGPAGPGTSSAWQSELSAQTALGVLLQSYGDSFETEHFNYLIREGQRDWDVVELMTYANGTEGRIGFYADVKAVKDGNTSARSFVTNARIKQNKQGWSNGVMDISNASFTVADLLSQWDRILPGKGLLIIQDGSFVTVSGGGVVQRALVGATGSGLYAGVEWLTTGGIGNNTAPLGSPI